MSGHFIYPRRRENPSGNPRSRQVGEVYRPGHLPMVASKSTYIQFEIRNLDGVLAVDFSLLIHV